MSWIVDTRASKPRDGTIGPGRLVLVVGPSGAGKDTLIDGARTPCLQDETIVFQRRVVTRPPSPSEDNDWMSDQDFDHAVANGGFALWWDAHGHRYGIPACIDDEIHAGRTVVCNVSRSIVDRARQRYAEVTVVLVTAPLEILAARIASRNRSSDGDIAARVDRTSGPERDYEPDFIIYNAGPPAAGIRRLVNAIRDPGLFVVY